MHSFSTGEISKYFSCITEIFAMLRAEIVDQASPAWRKKTPTEITPRSAQTLIRYC
jgi:hypothetical protein